MQVGQFPASAATSLIEGYCDDFVSIAVVLAQTLEQVSIRGIPLDRSRPALQRIENGMRELAEAIHELLERGQVTSVFTTVLGKDEAPAPAPAARGTATPPAAKPSAPSTPSAPAEPRPAVDKSAAARPAPNARPAPPAARPPAPSAARSPAARPPEPNRPTPTAPPSPSPAAPAPARAPRAAEPATAPPSLVTVFRDLGRAQASGTLYVETEGETLAFELLNGCVNSTATDRIPPAELLGELLIELGLSTRAAIDAVVARVDHKKQELLGAWLLAAGAVDEAGLVAALEEQVRRRFRRVCAAAKAAHEFADGEYLHGDGRIRVPIASLLGAR